MLVIAIILILIMYINIIVVKKLVIEFGPRVCRFALLHALVRPGLFPGNPYAFNWAYEESGRLL